MARMRDKHPCVKDFRAIGLFGILDLQKNSAGEPAAPYNGSSEAMGAMNAFLREQGLFTFLRWSHVMCNPPLVITEEQLQEGWDIIDRGLDIVDSYFEG